MTRTLKYIEQELMKGDDVRMLQAVLNYHRLPAAGQALDVDGYFGEKTRDRVKEFQTINQIDSDGIVGPQTRQKLMTICQFAAEYVVLSDANQLEFP